LNQRNGTLYLLGIVQYAFGGHGVAPENGGGCDYIASA
jgi:hypothetical protein